MVLPPMNPVAEVQQEIAGLLHKEPWFEEHKVEIIEQNKQNLYFFLSKPLAQVNHVVAVIGIDSFTNNYSALEMNVTVTCYECVTINRMKKGFVTALDVIQAIIQCVDGVEWWHFDKCDQKEDPKQNELICTATFRGQVDRDFVYHGKHYDEDEVDICAGEPEAGAETESESENTGT